MEIVATAHTMSEETSIPTTELIDRFFFYSNNQPPPVKPLTIVPEPTGYTVLQLDPELND